MVQHSAAEIERLNRAIAELYAAENLEMLPRAALAALDELFPGDVHAWNLVDFRARQFSAFTDPPEIDSEDRRQAVQRRILEHPITQHWLRVGDAPAAMLSDFWSRGQYERSALYDEVFREQGIGDMLVAGVLLPYGAVSLGVGRGARTFSEADRAMLEHLRPHLSRVYHLASMLTRHQELAEAAGVFLLRVTHGGRLVDPSPQAERLLRAYAETPDPDRLPPRVLGWLQESWELRCGTAGMPRTVSDLVLRGPDGHLSLAFIADKRLGEATLLLRERPALTAPSIIQQLGLTPREAEVVALMVDGWTAPEISDRLQVSLRTARNLIWRSSRKLGANNRAEAVAAALRAISPP